MPSVHLVKAVQRAMKTIQQDPSSTAAPATHKGKDKQQQNKGVYDIWDAEPSSQPGKKKQQEDNKEAEEEEYVDKQTLEARRRKPNTVARRHPNKEAVPLVRRPMPGQSYHPERDAHQAALQKVGLVSYVAVGVFVLALRDAACFGQSLQCKRLVN